MKVTKYPALCRNATAPIMPANHDNSHDNRASGPMAASLLTTLSGDCSSTGTLCTAGSADGKDQTGAVTGPATGR
ncbi:hypothetical protein MTY81_15870 [Mycolicibacterium sp. TY81]|nr:hypothetical protein MTY81_15870 [Mycolicibacterium sp. TY81]